MLKTPAVGILGFFYLYNLEKTTLLLNFSFV